MAQDPLYHFPPDTTKESIDSQNAWNERFAGWAMAGGVMMGGAAWLFDEDPVLVGLYPALGVALWFGVLWECKRRRYRFWEWEVAWEAENARRAAAEHARREDLRRRYLETEAPRPTTLEDT